MTTTDDFNEPVLSPEQQAALRLDAVATSKALSPLPWKQQQAGEPELLGGVASNAISLGLSRGIGRESSLSAILRVAIRSISSRL